MKIKRIAVVTVIFVILLAIGVLIGITASATNENETKYGIIPEQYLNPDEYPFLIFQGGQCVAGIQEDTNKSAWKNVISSVIGYATESGSQATILLRRDYYSNQIPRNVGNINGIVDIDLNGHTLTAAQCLIRPDATYNGTLNFKDGSILALNYALIYGAASNAQVDNAGVASTYNINFENIYIGYAEPGSTTCREWLISETQSAPNLSVTMIVNFKGCVIDFCTNYNNSTVATVGFGSTGTSDNNNLHIILSFDSECTLIAESTASIQFSDYTSDTHTTDKLPRVYRDSDGNYPEILIKSASIPHTYGFKNDSWGTVYLAETGETIDRCALYSFKSEKATASNTELGYSLTTANTNSSLLNAENYPFLMLTKASEADTVYTLKGGYATYKTAMEAAIEATKFSATDANKVSEIVLLMRRNYISTSDYPSGLATGGSTPIVVDMNGYLLGAHYSLGNTGTATASQYGAPVITYKDGYIEAKRHALLYIKSSDVDVETPLNFTVNFENANISFAEGAACPALFSYVHGEHSYNSTYTGTKYNTQFYINLNSCKVDMYTNRPAVCYTGGFRYGTTDLTGVHISYNSCDLYAGVRDNLNYYVNWDNDAIYLGNVPGKDYTRITFLVSEPNAPWWRSTKDGTTVRPMLTTIDSVHKVYRMIPQPVSEMTFVPQVNITLDRSLVLNVFVPKVDTLTQFVFNNQTYTDFSELEVATINGAEYYAIRTPLAASEAARSFELVATVQIADGKTANGTFTYSIPKYAKLILENNSLSVPEKQLVRDMLAYIKAAYTYFGSKDQSGISDITALIGENYELNNVPAFDGSTVAPTEGLVKVQLSLDSTPAIKFFPADINEAEKYKFFSAGVPLDTEVNISEGYIEMDVFAYTMANTITYSINGVEKGSFHIHSYYDYITTNSEYKNDEKLRNVVECFWKYCQSARAYKLDMAPTTAIDPDSFVSIVENSATPYRIVYANGYEVEAVALVNKLRALGVNALDATPDSDTESVSDYEIIIGCNVKNRPADCIVSVASLNRKNYVIKVVGERIVIAGATSSLVDYSVNKFVETYLDVTASTTLLTNAKILKTVNISLEYNYDIDSIIVNHNDLENYIISCDKSNSSVYPDVSSAIQGVILNKAGYDLDVVDIDSAYESSKKIIIRSVSDAGHYGFRVLVSGDNLIIECADDRFYSDAINEFITDVFKTQSLLSFSNSYSYTNTAAVYTYEDFGAKGDGKTNDYEAIYKTHVAANDIGKKVVGTPGKTYYISDTWSYYHWSKSVIPIKTDVDWTGSSFYIDDKAEGLHDSWRASWVFSVMHDTETENNTKSLDTTAIGNLTSNTALSKDASSIPWLASVLTAEKSYVALYNTAQYGYPTTSMATRPARSDIIIVNRDGTIDSTTPLAYDFSAVTSLTVIPVTDTPITITGGHFTTNAPSVTESDAAQDYVPYVAYNRGIIVNRFDVTMQNLEHVVVGEPTGTHGYSYPNGFIGVYTSYNFTLRDSNLQGRVAYAKSSSGYHGSYDLAINECINPKVINIIQEPNGVKQDIKDQKYWGLNGSNLNKNMYFEGCVISRIDTHKGSWNVTIKNCTIGFGINMIGGGNLTIENTTRRTNAAFITLRNDYGATWQGDVYIKNCHFNGYTGFNTKKGESYSNKSYVSSICVIDCRFYANSGNVTYDYGSARYMPINVHLDGFTAGSDDKTTKIHTVYVFNNLNDAVFASTVPYGGYKITKLITYKNMTKPMPCSSSASTNVYAIPVNAG